MCRSKCDAANSSSRDLRRLYERARIYALRHAGWCGCDVDGQRAAIQSAYVAGARSAVPAQLSSRLVLDKIAQDEHSLTIKIWL